MFTLITCDPFYYKTKTMKNRGKTKEKKSQTKWTACLIYSISYCNM